MLLLDEQNTEAYLRDTGRIAPGDRVTVRELSGGVSNMVLEIDFPGQPSRAFVVKQARAQLRTAQAWYSNVERIWREADVLRICDELIKRPPSVTKAMKFAASTPEILFEDRQQYLFAMTAAPRPHTVWKQDLLAGHTDVRIATACGLLLSTLHGASWQDPAIAKQLGDTTLFDQLRVDPYYRTLAAAHPEMREPLNRLIDSLAAHPRSLVHADFSPKNLLVSADRLLMVDFETGHYGDPAFDLGFFLSHLVLKACYHAPRHEDYLTLTEAFWLSYNEWLPETVPPAEVPGLWARGIQNFAGCVWARIDGKSPVDYLTDPARRELMRGLAREILTTEPRDWFEVTALCRARFGSF